MGLYEYFSVWANEIRTRKFVPQLGLSMGRAGRVFAQPATDPYKIGWSFFNPQPTHSSNGFVGSDCRRVVVGFGWTRLSLESFETRRAIQDPVRSSWIWRDFCQIVMRNHWFGQIRCLLCQKSTDLSEKVAGIWKKLPPESGKVVGIWEKIVGIWER